MQTQVGGEAIRRIRPTSLKELSLTNAIMRLSPNEDMNPIDRLIEHKANINLWYQEMRDNGLNEHEMSIMEKYLLSNYSAAPEQEDVMHVNLDEKKINYRCFFCAYYVKKIIKVIK